MSDVGVGEGGCRAIDMEGEEVSVEGPDNEVVLVYGYVETFVKSKVTHM